ncbi:MAG TPA: LysR substrate-binding domain-containing protein [Planctomycetaceae bacterium]|nr:LysR substrate-binding domain-containing protein [Planctomycetaceae bacterium]
MNAALACPSTDQIAAFVELARQGSLRRAADVLLITEQGLRNRLIALEQRLKVELYRKSRGRRNGSPLTADGRRFLPQAAVFLERARDLTEVFGEPDSSSPRVIHVAATQYLILHVMIDAVRRFHKAFPQIRVRLSNRIEQEIEDELLGDSDVEVGVAAPYEPSALLEYTHLFSMPWSAVTPLGHRLARRKRVRLEDLAGEPLILFERGSTGRQHVIDAFHGRGLSPRVEMETTNTEIIVRMVEAGLGVSIVPLLASGIVTRGRRVAVRRLGEAIRPIHSGILTRRDEAISAPAREFVTFLVRHAARPRRHGT